MSDFSVINDAMDYLDGLAAQGGYATQVMGWDDSNSGNDFQWVDWSYDTNSNGFSDEIDFYTNNPEIEKAVQEVYGYDPVTGTGNGGVDPCADGKMTVQEYTIIMAKVKEMVRHQATKTTTAVELLEMFADMAAGWGNI